MEDNNSSSRCISTGEDGVDESATGYGGNPRYWGYRVQNTEMLGANRVAGAKILGAKPASRAITSFITSGSSLCPVTPS
jgi:hypothetical protein